MSPNTLIAVIGGAGKSGQFLVRELIQQNIPFRLLLRSPAAANNPSAANNLLANTIPANQIIKGDVRDPAALRQLCQNCTALISTLGQSKGEPPVFSEATRNILAAMHSHEIKRYILTTGLNVDTPNDKKGPSTQAGTDWMKQHYAVTTADKQREYELLKSSNTDWTLVRLPLIGLTEASAPIATSLEDCPGSGIHGTDLAKFLISQLEDTTYLRKAPFLANK